MIHRHLAYVLAGSASLAAVATASVPVQAAQFEYVSPSVIVMRGIAPSRRAMVKPKTPPRQAAADPDANVKTMTAEDRRVLRYGVDEMSSIEAAKAERKIAAEEETAAVVEEAAGEPPAETAAEPPTEPEAPVVRQASFDSSNTTVKIEPATAPRRVKWESPANQEPDPAARQAMERRQHEAETEPPLKN